MRTALLAGASAAALLSPMPALALTPEEAWQGWQDAAEEAGVVLTVAERDESGDTLTLTGVAYALEAEDGTTMTGTMDEVVFDGQGDGTVVVTLPDSYPLTLSDPGLDGMPPGSAAMTISHPGMSLVMSDTDDGGTATDYAAPEIAVTLVEVAEGGTAQDISGSVTLTGVEGRNTRGGGDMPSVEGAFTAAEIAAAFVGTDPETGGTFDFSMSAADVSSTSSGTLSTLYAATDDLGAMIEDGFAVRGEGGTGPVSLTLVTEGMPESFSLDAGMTGTSGTFRIDGERMEYDFGFEGTAFTASGSEIPFPQVTGGLGALRTLISVPSTPTDEAQAMDLTVALRDLTLGEEIWSLFDPAGQLPRDPATLVVDLGGQMRMLTDMFSEEAMMSGEAPAEVTALDIEELRLALAGALLTGEGGFTFDYDAPGPFGPGSPAPDGGVNLRLEGGQGLLETLVGMGLLPEEQAMMVRMMTGMVARPAPEGGDVLLSDITVQPDGTVLANGAPLPF
jgi:hypothetical protein